MGAGDLAVGRGDERFCRRRLPIGIYAPDVSVLRPSWSVHRDAADVRTDPVYAGVSGFDLCRPVKKCGDPPTAVSDGIRMVDGGGSSVAGLAMVGAPMQLSTAAVVSDGVYADVRTPVEWQ